METGEKTRAMFKRALACMPSGVTSNYRYWGDKKSLVLKRGEGAYIWDQDDKKYLDYRMGFGPVILGHGYPAVIERGKGVWVTDVDGNVFLDFSAGIGVVASGHCHPEVVKVIKEQSTKLLHMSGTDFYYPNQANLAEKLAEIVPGAKNKKVFFCNSGAEAVECAMKLARYHRRRARYIAFTGAFHGRTFGALSLTASKVTQRRYFSPLLSGVTHVSYAYCYRCPYNLEYPGCSLQCATVIEEVYLDAVSPAAETAALFVEPLQGEGGYILPPDDFFKKLSSICKRNKILLVTDEVQSGFGRTGTMFVSTQYGVEPDILVVGKAMANGIPTAAYVARDEIGEAIGRPTFSTYGGNPLASARLLHFITLRANFWSA